MGGEGSAVNMVDHSRGAFLWQCRQACAGGVFLTNHEMFVNVIKYCIKCLILLLKRNEFIRKNKECNNYQSFRQRGVSYFSL